MKRKSQTGHKKKKKDVVKFLNNIKDHHIAKGRGVLPEFEVTHKAIEEYKPDYTSNKALTPVSINSPGPRSSFSNEIGQFGMENIENLLNINAAKELAKAKTLPTTSKIKTDAPAIRKSWNIFNQDKKKENKKD